MKTMAEKYIEATLMGTAVEEKGVVFEGLQVRVFPDRSAIDQQEEESGEVHPDAWALLEDTISAEENPEEMVRLRTYLEGQE
jgi:hypothetical protein